MFSMSCDSAVLSGTKYSTSVYKRGLLMLCCRFGVVVLLGVIFGSLAFSPGDDAMDMLSSSSLLIWICLGLLFVCLGLFVVDVY